MIRKEKRTQEGRTTKGITLIALVVTIVVLLILAGVTINAVLGDNGIITQAQKAADAAEKAAENDEDNIKDLAEQINNMTNDPPTTIEEAIERNYKFTENKDIKDEFDNPVTIPAGFHIVTPTEDDTVEYDYSDTKEGTPTVQDGIVIEDGEGNQFVWIPVGTVKNKLDDTNGATTPITLGRYSFAPGTGAPSQFTNSSYSEDAKNNHTKDNKPALDIEAFKTSTNTKGGYYLARYEAGIVGYDSSKTQKANSSSDTNWTGYKAKTDDVQLKLVSKKDEQVWNYITQPKASEVARGMYASESFTSDLVNSYAWDTAIVFIQKYSGDTDYSIENGQTFSSSLRNTGAGTGKEGNKIDKVCNIYDMASNCFEWSTETYSINNGRSCLPRGGVYGAGYGYRHTSYRSDNYGASDTGIEFSFRPVLYVLDA